MEDADDMFVISPTINMGVEESTQRQLQPQEPALQIATTQHTKPPFQQKVSSL